RRPERGARADRMSSLDELLSRMWSDYVAIAPQAERIRALLGERGERIVNDHIALRGFDLPGVDIEALDREFVAAGYQAAQSYEFPDKHLLAYHYEHADQRRPRLFISALDVASLSSEAQAAIGALVAQVPAGAAAEPMFATSGRRWSIDHATYQRLRAESEYAAWLAAFGFRANHFTISVNHLTTVAGLAELDAFLPEQGFQLNQSG